MEDRRAGKVINGKVGTFTDAVRQLQPLIWMVIAIVSMVGFRFITPSEEIHDLKAQLILLQEQANGTSKAVDALVRVQCLRSTIAERKLAGLKCD